MNLLDIYSNECYSNIHKEKYYIKWSKKTMSRKNDKLTVNIDSELLYKYICKYFKISLREQLSFTMLKYVNSFEEINGPIETTKTT